MNNPKVEISVVIPTYNGEKYIEQTVQSALSITSHPLDILVVDDGSTDNTAELMKPYLDRVRYIQKENGGPASARNLGVKEAYGEFIAFLDGDDLWQPEKFEKQMPLFDDPEVALVYAEGPAIDENNNPLEHDSGLPKPKIKGQVFEQLFANNVIPTSTVIARRQAILDAGLFDEDRSLISVEDYDLWLRIAAASKFDYVSDPLTLYRVHSESISKNHARSYFGEKKVLEKNKELFANRFPQIATSWNQRLATLFQELAQEYYTGNNLSEARKYFRESLKYNFWQPKLWIYILTTLMGRGFVSSVRRLKGTH